jgi:hypothetical protein
MVLANGSIVTASKSQNPDLFWAASGCGSAFGVATQFVYQGYPQGDIWSGLLIFTPDKLEGLVKFANYFHDANDGKQSLSFGFSSPPPHNQAAILCVPFFDGPKEEGEKFFADLLALGPVVNGTSTMPYEKMNGILNDAVTFGGRKTGGGSAVKLPLNISFIQSIFDNYIKFIQSHEDLGESVVLFEIVPYKKVVEVPLENTAYANRGEYYNVGTVMKWYDPSLDTTVRTYARSLHKMIREGGGTMEDKGTGAYANYIGMLVPSIWRAASMLVWLLLELFIDLWQIIRRPLRKFLVRTGTG